MRLVILESPCANNEPLNIGYARLCLLDALSRGESPLPSHLLYTQPGMVNDAIPGQRTFDTSAGLAWYHVADASVVYTDLGISQGMELGITEATSAGVPVEIRHIEGWPDILPTLATDSEPLPASTETLALLADILKEETLATAELESMGFSVPGVTKHILRRIKEHLGNTPPCGAGCQSLSVTIRKLQYQIETLAPVVSGGRHTQYKSMPLS